MNTLEYATIFQSELDRQVLETATSGWMEQNAGQVRYSGGNEVKVPIIGMDGLGDYDRTSGFVQGSVTLEYQTMTLTQDRARTFMLDSMDVDETNFIASASNVMGEFQRTHVVPEIDAYRYSKLAALTPAANQTTGYTPAADTILDKLRQDIYGIWDAVGDGSVELVIMMAVPAAQVLSSSSEITKQLGVTDFKRGDISTKVQSIDEIPIIKVPSARMWTEYEFKTGAAGQTEGGFAKTAAAKEINWIIAGRKLPIAISKTEKVRIFEPDKNLNADAWKLDYRKYHDLWAMKNKLNQLRINTK